MSVKGILFDAGDTLYGPIGGRWNPRFDFEEVLLRYYPQVPASLFPAAFRAGQRFLDEASSMPPRDDYHRTILSELGVHHPSPALIAELNRTLEMPVVEVFPDVPPVLHELRARRIRMAIVSDNWAGIEQVLEALGLREFFDVFVISEVMGCSKPDSRMYRAGSDGLGLMPPDCLFVDNDPDLVVAAIGLGYQGVCIDRYGSRNRSDVSWISSLDELWPLL
jgi:HAD superfamily hydrolase (TIGR01509 family)